MNKNNNLTFIHIAAALLVILGHQYALLQLPAPRILGVDAHGLGVRILFLVSGYLVSTSYSRSKRRSVYLIKRLSRLYPSLTVCLLITVLFCYPLSESQPYYWGSAKRYFLQNLCMKPTFDLGGVFSHNPYSGAINGSLWTLPIEAGCYLILIFVVDVYRKLSGINKAARYSFFPILLLCLSGFNVFRAVKLPGEQLVFYGTDLYAAGDLMVFFLIGVCIDQMHLEKYLSWQAATTITVIFMCAQNIPHAFLTPFVVSFDVMCFGLAEKPLFANTVKRDTCYGLYLYAFPIQQVLIYIFRVRLEVEMPVYLYFFTSVLLIWAIAEVDYRLVERPCAKTTDAILRRLQKKKDIAL